jgi:hypothetical protein
MNKATRLLALTGMALVAGVTMGAGPASAATTTAAKAPSHDRIEGYFHSRLQCERSGRFGEMRDRWDSHDCSPVRFGRHRGDWVLEVSQHRGPFGHDRPSHDGSSHNGSSHNGSSHNRPPFHH